MAKSLYDILGVAPTATAEQIRQSYLLLNKMLHPDKFDQKQQPKEWHKANEMLKELNEAYAVLRHPAPRAQYDRSLANRQADQAAANVPGNPAGVHGLFVPPPLKAATVARTMTIVVAVLCLLVLPQTCTHETIITHPGAVYNLYEQRDVTAWGQVAVWTAIWCALTYAIFRGSKSVYE